MLQEKKIKAVTYPSDKEERGIVMVGWQGPSVVRNYYEYVN